MQQPSDGSSIWGWLSDALLVPVVGVMVNFSSRLKSLETSKEDIKEDLTRIEGKLDRVIEYLLEQKDS